LLSQHYPTSA